MAQSWYKQCMFQIGQVTSHLTDISHELKNIKGVKNIYIWGSYAKNITHENYRIADLDIILKTSFDSGDLLSINENILKENYVSDYLEEQGFDPAAVKFSKDLTNIKKFNIDYWVISSDNNLLHWGPMPGCQRESEEINSDAEKFATKKTGITRNKVNRSSEKIRKNWYSSYVDFKKKYFSTMPSGWYKSEENNIKSILEQAIKI
jgi:predicted nucleotidyltransferase